MSTSAIQSPSGWRQQLAAGWQKQTSVIAALIIKDFKLKASKDRFGMIWLVVDPIVMLVMMAGLWYLIGRTEMEGIPVSLYISSGLIVYTILRQNMTSVPGAIKANSGLLNYPQVKPISCIFARFLFELFMLLISACILYFVLWWSFGLAPKYNDPLRTCQAIGIAMIFGLGISLLLGVYATLYPTVGKLASLVSRPLMFLSCVIHSLHDLPPTPRHYMLYNPIVHLVETARESLFALHPFPGVSLVYPGIWAVCTLGLGVIAYYANRFKLIRE